MYLLREVRMRDDLPHSKGRRYLLIQQEDNYTKKPGIRRACLSTLSDVI